MFALVMWLTDWLTDWLIDWTGGWVMGNKSWWEHEWVREWINRSKFIIWRINGGLYGPEGLLIRWWELVSEWVSKWMSDWLEKWLSENEEMELVRARMGAWMDKQVKVRNLEDKWRIIRPWRIVNTSVRTRSSATSDLTKTATSAETSLVLPLVFNIKISRILSVQLEINRLNGVCAIDLVDWMDHSS